MLQCAPCLYRTIAGGYEGASGTDDGSPDERAHALGVSAAEAAGANGRTLSRRWAVEGERSVRAERTDVHAGAVLEEQRGRVRAAVRQHPPARGRRVRGCGGVVGRQHDRAAGGGGVQAGAGRRHDLDGLGGVPCLAATQRMDGAQKCKWKRAMKDSAILPDFSADHVSAQCS